MASPYPKPITPHDPNGIAHYVARVDRSAAKASWKLWVKSYKLAIKNSTPIPAPFNWDSLYTNSP